MEINRSDIERVLKENHYTAQPQQEGDVGVLWLETSGRRFVILREDDSVYGDATGGEFGGGEAGIDLSFAQLLAVLSGTGSPEAVKKLDFQLPQSVLKKYALGAAKTAGEDEPALGSKQLPRRAK